MNVQKTVGEPLYSKNLMAWRGLDSMHFGRWKHVQLPLISEGNKNPWTSKEPKRVSVIWNQALNLAAA
jgi:hypothetical protein